MPPPSPKPLLHLLPNHSHRVPTMGTDHTSLLSSTKPRPKLRRAHEAASHAAVRRTQPKLVACLPGSHFSSEAAPPPRRFPFRAVPWTLHPVSLSASARRRPRHSAPVSTPSRYFLPACLPPRSSDLTPPCLETPVLVNASARPA
jgi:hypothetical protein